MKYEPTGDPTPRPNHVAATGIYVDPVRHRLALPLLERRLALLDAALRGGSNTRHIYANGAGYGELLALAKALDAGVDFAVCEAYYSRAIELCNGSPFATMS